MKTVPFRSVLHSAARKMGFVPTELQDSDAAALAEFIKSRTREYWEKWDWQWATVWEERIFRYGYPQTDYKEFGDYPSLVRDIYEDGQTYNTADEVFFNGAYFVCGADGVTDSPSQNAAVWTEFDDFARFLAFDEKGLPEIGDLFGVYIDEYGSDTIHWIENDGAIFLPHSLGINSVWINYRVQPSEFTTDFFQANTAYSRGAVIYDTADGECYKAHEDIAAAPTRNASQWRRMRMPYVLAEAVAHAAYADWLRATGQNDKARAEEKRAETLLENEIDKLNQKGYASTYTARLPWVVNATPADYAIRRPVKSV